VQNTMRSAARLTMLALVALLAALAVAAPAQAKPTIEKYGKPLSAPLLSFDKNPDSPLNSKLKLYFSIGKSTYTATVRAGSGNGTKNDCTKNKGWLPNGTYSNIPHYKKTGGNEVVRGWVWQLGSKKCSSGSTTRTELFVHSNGIEGTKWDGKYGTQGCIKISQDSRKWFSTWWRGSSGASKGDLKVKS